MYFVVVIVVHLVWKNGIAIYWSLNNKIPLAKFSAEKAKKKIFLNF